MVSANSPKMLPVRLRHSTTSLSTSTDPTHPATKKKHSITPPTSDRMDRTSFSSIKENHSGVAQSFTDSKTSSYLRHRFDLAGTEDAVDDDSISGSSASPSGSGSVTPAEERLVITGTDGVMLQDSSDSLPSSFNSLLDFVPCEGFRGWKGISIQGRKASKSVNDLKAMAMKFEWESIAKGEVEVGGHARNLSPLEKLPTEVLGKIPSFNFHFYIVPHVRVLIFEWRLLHLINSPPNHMARQYSHGLQSCPVVDANVLRIYHQSVSYRYST